MKMSDTYKIVFFGGEPLGAPVLEILKSHGIVPNLVVASPDKRAGRNMEWTPPPVKVWATANGIDVFQPENLKNKDGLTKITETSWDLFVVVAYNHILPEWLIELPKFKTINLHPSLLPKLRGPSPIRTAILEDKRDQIGATIIQLDKEMDHGPILASTPLEIPETSWPISGPLLDTKLTQLGGELLATVIKDWLCGTITPTAQDHSLATYTKKFTKDQGELMLDPRKLPSGDLAYQTYLKICAFAGIFGTYFFHENKRIKIIAAHLDGGQLIIDRVIPEGKKEVDFSDWLAST